MNKKKKLPVDLGKRLKKALEYCFYGMALSVAMIVLLSVFGALAYFLAQVVIQGFIAYPVQSSGVAIAICLGGIAGIRASAVETKP